MSKMYQKKPRKIEMVNNGKFALCENCGKTNKDGNVKILLNITNHKNKAKGKYTSLLYANENELWLCEDCLKELREAIK